ncbi:MAG TPA: L-threonylcarbamoyladenylate synthase [Pyrinomonadaceae bacterium]|nr:L-threonylcarbamoyladenylate synthase [Pyrinomonadaceae bacterium]
MKTVLTTSPSAAAEFIKRGGLAAFPTETVYGLGANVFDETAVAKIFEAKQRPGDNPLIAHVSDAADIAKLAIEISAAAQKFMEAFFPGPLTVVLRKSANVPLIATAGLDSVGVRMPRNRIAREFLTACGVPVAAPSANLSGRPSPTSWEAVFEDLNGRIDCILQGETTEIGLESTVVDCTKETPTVLRPGAVSIEQLRSVVRDTIIFAGSDSDKVPSPGMRHRHYSPRAKVRLIDTDSDVTDTEVSAFIGLKQPVNDHALTKLCGSPEEYAHSLFAFFRECDLRGIPTIYCETVPEKGIGVALMDRLRRAAAR